MTLRLPATTQIPAFRVLRKMHFFPRLVGYFLQALSWIHIRAVSSLQEPALRGRGFRRKADPRGHCRGQRVLLSAVLATGRSSYRRAVT